MHQLYLSFSFYGILPNQNDLSFKIIEEYKTFIHILLVKTKIEFLDLL